MGILEAQPSWSLNFSQVCKANIHRCSLSEEFWPQREGIEVAGSVENKDTERVVLLRIRKRHAAGLDRHSEVEVED